MKMSIVIGIPSLCICKNYKGSCYQSDHAALLFTTYDSISLVMRKPAFCICENKDADQLRGNREPDQRLCFRYIDTTIPLLSKSEISGF